MDILFSAKTPKLNYLYTFIIMIFLTACGGGNGTGAGTPELTAKEKAIEKITAYAADGSRPAPTLQDYLDAGVTGVTAENLDQINEVVEALEEADVDTTAELDALTAQFNINIKPSANAGDDKTVQVNQSISLTGSGTDADGTIVGYRWAKGATELATTASFDYTPSVVGTDTLTLTVTDDDGATAIDTVKIVVTSTPNQVPTVENISVNIVEDSATDIALDGNDANGDSLSYTKVTDPAHGTVSFNAGIAIYTPNANYNGSDSFTYKANDGSINSNTATVNITVTAVNDAPTASDVSTNTPKNILKSITLNGIDVDGDSLSYSIVSNPAHGTISLLDDTVSYTPANNYSGADSFTYKANDGTEDSNIATVNINVDFTNTAPIANNISATTDEGLVKVISLSGSDSDGDTLIFTQVSAPQHGSVSIIGDTATYTPNANYNGSDSFTYIVNDNTVNSNTATVSITISAINDAPVAYPTTASTDEDTAKAITLTASDVDADTLSYNVVDNPTNGTVSFANNIATYTPTSDYHGSDSFTYNVNDGTVDSNTATVNITVNSVNDDPTANDISTNTLEDTAKAITLIAADNDGDNLTYIKVTDPANGTVTFVGDIATYTPASNYTGSDSFTYKVNDGTVDSNAATVTINVGVVNDAPVATNASATTDEDTTKAITLTATDVDGDSLSYSVVANPSNGAVSFTNNVATYIPNGNYHGSDSFTYKVNDGTVDSNTATVTITVSAINDSPVASNGSAITAEDTAKSISLTATDADGDSLSYSVVASPSNGTVSFVNNVVTYTPSANYNGDDSFTYKANDGTADSNTATVTITVNSVNDGPTASDVSINTLEDTVKAITLVAEDIDGDSLSYIKVTDPANGTVSFVGDLATYTPASNYTGSDSFTYKVNDGTLDSNTATVTIEIGVVNDAPVATDASAIMDEDTLKEITLSATDADGDSLNYSVVAQPNNGTVSFVNNIATYTPSANYNGDDSFTYKASDGTADSNTATVTITVNAVNDVPTVTAGADIQIKEGETITLNGSATDPDTNDTLSYTWSPATNLNNANIAQPDFTAPAVTADTDEVLTLSVTDGTETVTASVTISILNLPAQPQNVQVSAGNTQITVSWDSVADATAYDICIATDAIGTPANCAVLQGGALHLDRNSPATLTGLSNDTPYYIMVIPKNTNGAGIASAEVTATPAAAAVQPTPTGKLNDTGITSCGDYAYDAGGTLISGHTHSNSESCGSNTDTTDAEGDPIPAGQDGHFVTGFSFTKLNAAGAPLTNQADPSHCVKDNVTGLIWEVKTSSGLHNKNDRYTWYSTDASNNGGAVGYARQSDSSASSPADNTCSGYVDGTPSTYCNTQDYVARVNAEGWCGASDWRLPTREELRSITDRSEVNPAIDTGYFPNQATFLYWSSTPRARDSIHAWALHFGGGQDYVGHKAYLIPVRLVRSRQ